jgi:hypothetical protein
MFCFRARHATFCRVALKAARVTETPPTFVRELREQLVAAAQRRVDRRRKRQKRLLAGVCAVAVVITATATLQLQQDPSQASALDVRRVNDVIAVDLKATNASSDQIIEDLKRFGIEASINEVPVSHNATGYFFGVETQDPNTDVTPSGQISHFTLPDLQHQKITISRGRPANPDETYAYSTNAYLPGEPLHCSNTLGRRLKDVSHELESRNLSVKLQSILSANEPLQDANANDQWVVSAITDKPNSVVIFVSPEPINLVATTDCSE